MDVRRSWGIIGVLSFLVTASTVWAAHDEARFGKALAFQKVEGITACSAVEVVGNRGCNAPKNDPQLQHHRSSRSVRLLEGAIGCSCGLRRLAAFA